MFHVAPLMLSHPFFLKSLSTRETVSRDVPVSCAISSCVNVTRIAMPAPFFLLDESNGCSAQLSKSLAIFSGTELDSPRDLISLYAHWQLWVSCWATFMPTSGYSWRKRENSI